MLLMREVHFIPGGSMVCTFTWFGTVKAFDCQSVVLRPCVRQEQLIQILFRPRLDEFWREHGHRTTPPAVKRRTRGWRVTCMFHRFGESAGAM